jgi:hypothetical protein
VIPSILLCFTFIIVVSSFYLIIFAVSLSFTPKKIQSASPDAMTQSSDSVPLLNRSSERVKRKIINPFSLSKPSSAERKLKSFDSTFAKEMIKVVSDKASPRRSAKIAPISKAVKKSYPRPIKSPLASNLPKLKPTNVLSPSSMWWRRRKLGDISIVSNESTATSEESYTASSIPIPIPIPIPVKTDFKKDNSVNQRRSSLSGSSLQEAYIASDAVSDISNDNLFDFVLTIDNPVDSKTAPNNDAVKSIDTNKAYFPRGVKPNKAAILRIQKRVEAKTRLEEDRSKLYW